jgi:hypothetical protein
MISKPIVDFVVMVLFVVFSIVLLAWGIPTQIEIAQWNTGSSYTAQTFPYLLGYIFLGVSILGTITTGLKLWKSRNAEKLENPEKKGIEWKPVVRTFLMILTVFGYYLIFKWLGFIIATVIAMPLLLLILANKKWWNLLYLYLFSALVFVVFRYVLIIQIP